MNPMMPALPRRGRKENSQTGRKSQKPGKRREKKETINKKTDKSAKNVITIFKQHIRVFNGNVARMDSDDNGLLFFIGDVESKISSYENNGLWVPQAPNVLQPSFDVFTVPQIDK
ncbi:hypothetical protein V2J09_001823 [Rumex salicifolius]